jgi:phosphoenolpyruvate synthase/pyruvate phosphate dikinase
MGLPCVVGADKATNLLKDGMTVTVDGGSGVIYEGGDIGLCETVQFIGKMVDSLRNFAAEFSPRPVIYRTMYFRSNEVRQLKGGDKYEPTEQNPMLGYRGVFRYAREPDLFKLELEAVKGVRDECGVMFISRRTNSPA